MNNLARKRCSISACLVLVAMLCCTPANAARKATPYKKGDRVEAKEGFDWKPGTVVAIDRNGWVQVKLDNVDLPVEVPAELREKVSTRPFPPDDVRSEQAAEAKPAKASEPAATRNWKDRSGKFSVDARFDGVSGDKVGLVKSDGKRIEVPLTRLSDADQQYVRGIGNDDGNPFAEPGKNDSSSEGRSSDASDEDDGKKSKSAPKGNWTGAKIVRPQMFKKWSFTPTAPSKVAQPSGDAASALIPLNDITGSKKFFEKVIGIYVADDGSQAVVCRQKGAVGGKEQQFLELLDLKESASKGLAPLPDETAVLDVLPEAGLVAYRSKVFGSGNNNVLTIARFDGDKLATIKEFEPYAHEDWEPNRDIEKAWFLGQNRVMTLNHMGKTLTVWDISATKAVMNIPVGSWAQLELALSADRKLLAIIMKEGIAIIDLEAGKHVATLPAEGKDFNRVEFRSDNARLAAVSSEGAVVWDLTNGKKLADFYHGSLQSNSELAWAGDFLLSQNQYLYDPARRILLWEYQGATSWTSAGKSRAGRLWLIPRAEDGRETVLLSAAIPHDAAVQQAATLPPAEALLAVRPGDKVTIVTDIDPSVGSADEIRKSIADGLQAAGLQVVDGSKLVVKAVCKPQEPQKIKINMHQRPTLRPGSIGAIGNEVKVEERTITPNASSLEMTLNGETLWKRGYLAKPFMTIWVQQNENLDQALDRLTKPNLNLFKNAKFSGYVAKPGKATDNGAYGVSQISAQGVVDGKTASGKTNGAVFE